MGSLTENDARTAILDALEGADGEDAQTQQGIPPAPSLPLNGSLNVPIDANEERVES